MEESREENTLMFKSGDFQNVSLKLFGNRFEHFVKVNLIFVSCVAFKCLF